MSRGGYTAAIDMWSLGCIFGELLQRIAHVGSVATPNLQARAGGKGGGLAGSAALSSGLHAQGGPDSQCRCEHNPPWPGWTRPRQRSTGACPPQMPGPLQEPRPAAAPAACPPPQVAPLFAMHGLPKTPEDGESFLGGPGNEMTRSELQVGAALRAD